MIEDGPSILDSGDWGRLDLPFFLTDAGTVWGLHGSRNGASLRPGKGIHIIAQSAVNAATAPEVNFRGRSGSWLLLIPVRVCSDMWEAQMTLCQVATQVLQEVPCFLSLDGKHLGRETALREKYRS